MIWAAALAVYAIIGLLFARLWAKKYYETTGNIDEIDLAVTTLFGLLLWPLGLLVGILLALVNPVRR